tara:strand:+ start:200 stop:634 length:435 start_codon:yes stop_codon:yes gene_type:complete
MIEIKKFLFNSTKLMQSAHSIRHNVFVIGQKCPAELEYEFEEESTHFILINNNNPVATARHRKTQKGFKLERFAVIDSERGKGYGLMILNAILDDLKREKEIKYLHAQIQVTEFYEKVGFIKIGDLFEEAGIQHYKMIYKESIL